MPEATTILSTGEPSVLERTAIKALQLSTSDTWIHLGPSRFLTASPVCPFYKMHLLKCLTAGLTASTSPLLQAKYSHLLTIFNDHSFHSVLILIFSICTNPARIQKSEHLLSQCQFLTPPGLLELSKLPASPTLNCSTLQHVERKAEWQNEQAGTRRTLLVAGKNNPTFNPLLGDTIARGPWLRSFETNICKQIKCPWEHGIHIFH